MIRSLVLSIFLLFGIAGAVHAQSDPLAKCLADNTTGKDRKALARWIFVAMSAHPELRDISATSEASTEQANKAMAAIVTRLLTESCLVEAQAVIKKGEGNGMRRAFESLGALAMMELTSNQEVAASVSKFNRYIDQGKVAAALNGK